MTDQESGRPMGCERPQQTMRRARERLKLISRVPAVIGSFFYTKFGTSDRGSDNASD